MNNFQLEKLCKNIPYFRGVFMRDSLPIRVWKYECGIVNLDKSSGNGTHWVAYVKKDKKVKYFDSFGNLQPPIELISYLKKSRIVYNRRRYQSFSSKNCGELCFKFLLRNILNVSNAFVAR